MGHLSQEEQQLILDFYFRCGDESNILRGRDLIASNPEAARLYDGLVETLSGLDSLKYEPCPENLVELTVARLKHAAAVPVSGSSQLKALLKEQQDNPEYLPASQSSLKVKNGSRWRPVVEILATAAAIVLAAGILFPSLGAMRERSRQIACAKNLGQIGQALSAFAAEHNGRLSEIKVQSGSPWWKVGYQGPEIHSNTRYVWQLVKEGYVDGAVFVCGGHLEGRPVRFDAATMTELNDFPSRRHVSYSFMLLCYKNDKLIDRSRKIIVADMNPIFQQIPFQPSIYQQLNEFERVQLNEQLRQMLSPNHRRKGQNSLFCDGSVEFIQTRVYNNDDIFTIQGVDTYTGKETPFNPDDIFLVP